jgi:hypothetical protein
MLWALLDSLREDYDATRSPAILEAIRRVEALLEEEGVC